MKHIALLFIALAFTAVSSFAQIFQDFEPVFSLSSLSGKCWQTRGASITENSINGARSIALHPSVIGGAALLATPYIDLSASSTISFVYKLADTLSPGTTLTMTVYLQNVEGNFTLLRSGILDNSTNQFTFTATSPVEATRKLLIEIVSTGNAPAAVSVDDLSVHGEFNYNAPYKCKDQDEAPASIHYLKNFSGQQSGNKVQLQWTVAENINNNYFEVERSADGINYKAIALVWASAKPAEEAYHFSDPVQAIGYYRLRVVGKNNANMYSNVLVFKSSSVPSTLNLLQNPVRHQLAFCFTSVRKNPVKLVVYDISGNPVFLTNLHAQKGYNAFSIVPDKALRSGVYLLELTFGSERIAAKFLKE